MDSDPYHACCTQNPIPCHIQLSRSSPITSHSLRAPSIEHHQCDNHSQALPNKHHRSCDSLTGTGTEHLRQSSTGTEIEHLPLPNKKPVIWLQVERGFSTSAECRAPEQTTPAARCEPILLLKKDKTHIHITSQRSPKTGDEWEQADVPASHHLTPPASQSRNAPRGIHHHKLLDLHMLILHVIHLKFLFHTPRHTAPHQ